MVSSEVQRTYRTPSSWAAFVQKCNTQEAMARCFPWKARVNRVGLASVLIGPTSVKLLGKACLSETFEE